MHGRGDSGRSEGRLLRERAFAASILVAGLLLFVWPFVRTPPLDIGGSYAHLVGAWGVIVGLLALLARALGGGDDAGGPDA